jgi:hypothetical protein
VLIVIRTETGGIYAVLTVIVTITRRFIYIDLPVIVAITVNTTNKPPRYCHNNC